MLHDFKASYRNIRLRPLREEDIELLRVWRNDTVATRFLRPIGHITPEMQANWFRAYCTDPTIVTFAVEETDELRRTIGSVSLYDFEGGRGEFGKFQIGDSEAHGKGMAKIAAALAVKIAFEQLRLEEVVASVHQENLAAKKIYLGIGFEIVGQHPSVVGGLEDELKMEYAAYLEKCLPHIGQV